MGLILSFVFYKKSMSNHLLGNFVSTSPLSPVDLWITRVIILPCSAYRLPICIPTNCPLVLMVCWNGKTILFTKYWLSLGISGIPCFQSIMFFHFHFFKMLFEHDTRTLWLIMGTKVPAHITLTTSDMTPTYI